MSERKVDRKKDINIQTKESEINKQTDKHTKEKSIDQQTALLKAFYWIQIANYLVHFQVWFFDEHNNTTNFCLEQRLRCCTRWNLRGIEFHYRCISFKILQKPLINWRKGTATATLTKLNKNYLFIILAFLLAYIFFRYTVFVWLLSLRFNCLWRFLLNENIDSIVLGMLTFEYDVEIEELKFHKTAQMYMSTLYILLVFLIII